MVAISKETIISFQHSASKDWQKLILKTFAVKDFDETKGCDQGLLRLVTSPPGG
ncbi:hypothetical protein X743_10290 [Mesorhizobium sp. LNHC252B00]|nr:hypothetical protein X743_10290 [Mesorhizobium sp. LNHC252B00]